MDLALDANRDIAIPITFVSGPDETRQRIEVRLRTFRGEWFEDALQGVPYFERILEKGVTAPIVTSIVRAVVESVPGVAEVVSIRADIEKRTRTCRVSELRVRYSANGSVANVPALVLGIGL